MRIFLAFTALMLALGCGRRPDDGSTTSPEATGDASPMDLPHVVFTSESLSIDRLEVPTPPPVTASSRPSPAILESDDPRVVSIDALGRLVAHAPGSVKIRAAGRAQAVLRVRVSVPSAIRIEPAKLALVPRGSAPLVVLGDDGRPLPLEAVRWKTSAPGAVVVVGGTAHALGPPGSYELRAEVGQAEAVLPVTVNEGGSPIVVVPVRVLVKRGDLTLLRASNSLGPVQAEWTSDDPRVLSAVGQGLFQGMKPGRAKACARTERSVACSEVEVRR